MSRYYEGVRPRRPGGGTSSGAGVSPTAGATLGGLLPNSTDCRPHSTMRSGPWWIIGEVLSTLLRPARRVPAPRPPRSRWTRSQPAPRRASARPGPRISFAIGRLELPKVVQAKSGAIAVAVTPALNPVRQDGYARPHQRVHPPTALSAWDPDCPSRYRP